MGFLTNIVPKMWKSVKNSPVKLISRWDSFLVFYRADTPAVFPLVPNAGKQGDAVLAGGFQHGVIRLADLGNAGDGIRPGSLLGGQGDPVPVLQGVDFSEVAVGPPVVGREGDVAIPNAGVGEMACSLFQRVAAGALVDLA